MWTVSGMGGEYVLHRIGRTGGPGPTRRVGASSVRVTESPRIGVGRTYRNANQVTIQGAKIKLA
jgi:hypothetical protein